jgi:alcohol dehydrogenase, propanol-preferring
MKAMVLNAVGPLSANEAPLALTAMPEPVPAPGEILVRVTVCGVCHTELDEIEGRTPPPRLPIVPGHQVVGQVVGQGPGAQRFQAGERVGIAWIFSACGDCPYCRAGNENLCPDFKATGRDAHGGYAQYMTVPEGFAHPIPVVFTDAEAAPLLCAGAVGYRSLRLTNLQDGQAIGLTGFGASGHLVLKMVRHRYPQARAYVFARSKNQQAFAKELGAVWAGGTEEKPPEPINAIIDTTPVWKPVVAALNHLAPAGRLVINAIRKENHDKEELLKLDYGVHLWMEREIKSVANVSRRDVAEFLTLAAEMDIRPTVQEFPLEEANQALMELRTRQVHGAKVLRIT